MPDGVTCPECGKSYDTPRGFLSHWGHADDPDHEGPAPKDAYGGLEFSEEHREKITEAKTGMPTKEETKEKISETMTGMEAWSKGLTKEDDERVMNRAKALEGHTKDPEVVAEHSRRIKRLWDEGRYDDRDIDFLTGEDHPHYRHGGFVGGSGLKYPAEFNRQLRRQIRERDDRECRVCGDSPDEYRLHVHHIDADKENNDPENLVSLCSVCHKTMEFKPQPVQRMMYSTGPDAEWTLNEPVVA